MANIEAGNDTQLMIKSLVESYGLTISSTRSPGSVCAISTLEGIHDKYGFHVLDRTLRLCVGTWEGEPDSLSGNMLKGIAHLIVSFGETIRDDVFKDKIGKVSARELSRTARERKAGSMGYAEAILLEYNKKMKNPLHWSKLYEKKTLKTDGYDFEEDAEPMYDGIEHYEQSPWDDMDALTGGADLC